MMPEGTSSNFSDKARSLMHTLARWFPTPQFLLLRAAGIDISDSSVKWIVITPDENLHKVQSYGSEPLAEGVVVDGAIRNMEALVEILKRVRSKLGGIRCAHAALPEEAAYVFSMHVPEKTKRDQILNMIEFELDGRVPILPNAAAYDFDIIMEHKDGIGAEIGVTVFPRALAESYAAAFDSAGIKLLSLEVEARSIARAISSRNENEPITFSVDFGRARTGFAVLKRGIPIFTSTVGIGGESMTRAIMEKLSFTSEDAEIFKSDEGLLANGRTKNPGVEAIIGTLSALTDEIVKHYNYWDTRRDDKGERMTPVGRTLIVGGSANLKGLIDYIASRIQAPVERPNVWQNICSFDEYIPPIDRKTSMQFATSIGLALRGI
ncbi:hypothetical protein A3A37_00605 [Candidatus Kaiserbacteria bacterium RIFCSPLOWO2_01_FULL_52_36]|nr:MAG: hypothetical protein A3A37_00605 [Candidatus Kaiserbacteria bacterium RIFCSPLOWO2_01_FULL_52_36]